MAIEKVHFLPYLICIWFPFTFVLTYYIAVKNEDVSPLFPYISDTGTFTPESCIFGQFLNLGAMMMAVVGYIRFLQLKDICCRKDVPECVERLNFPSLIMGLAAALGISIVGNFQEKNSLMVHLFGAILAFFIGGFYISSQTYMAFKIYPHLGSKRLNWIRVVLSFGTFFFFITTFLMAWLAYKYGPTDEDGKHVFQKWKPEEKGWGLHFGSTLSEWIMAGCLIFYLASFASDFKRIVLETPTVMHRFEGRTV